MFKLQGPGGFGYYGLDARTLFLRAVAADAPTVLHALERDVYRKYKVLAGGPYGHEVVQLGDGRQVARLDLSAKSLRELSRSDACGHELVDTLDAWGDRFKLGCTHWHALSDVVAWQTGPCWVVECALHTCKEWYWEGGGGRHQFRIPGGAWAPLDDTEARVAVQIEQEVLATPIEIATRWEPALEKREHFERRVLEPFKKKYTGILNAQLTPQLDRIARAYKNRSGGFGEAAVKREREKHLKWLVQFHVLGWSYGEIVERHDAQQGDATPEREVVETTVSRAVRGLAEVLALKLRPHSKGGRPKKRLQ